MMQKEIPYHLRGILLMVCATFLAASMNSVARHLSDTLHPFEITFFRNFFALLFVVPMLVRYGFSALKTKRLKGHMARAILNVFNMMIFFYALSITPLSELIALGFTAPIFATILAVLILKEVVGIRRWGAIFLAFLGAIIVIQPGFEGVSFGQLMTLLASFMWAGVLLIIKSLSRTEASITIVAYMVILMTPMSLIPALFVWQWPTVNELYWLAFLGVAGGGAQFFLAQALRESDIAVVMPFDFFKLIWVSLIAFVIFREIPQLSTWAGGALIFISGIYIAHRETALQQTKNNT